ncbi:Uncharacterised protein [Mycobacteroides abscessus subsp. abscessus]|nr:Uncharacterised protein [Mycobacteroides abscessus subsp. abscessus]
MDPGQAAVIERLRGQRSEPNRIRLHLGPAGTARLAVPASPQIRPQRGVGVGDLADTRLGDLRPESGMLAGLGIGDRSQIPTPKHPLSVGNGRD